MFKYVCRGLTTQSSSLNASLTRSSMISECSATQMALRGPKKKKGGAVAGPISNDIVNIFKGKEDKPIYPSDSYPPWLMEMLDEKYAPGDVVLQMYRGERIPSAKEQWTLSNTFRRTWIKMAVDARKSEILYESEDDEGEQFEGVDADDLDEEAQGELGSDD